jgi:hypothetical protein
MPESQALINIMNKAHDTGDNAIGIIDITHKEIHEGDNYTKTITATKTAVQFLNVHLKKGLATYPKRHMVFVASGDQAASVKLYEMAKTSGAGGTTYTLLNNNRVSTKASSYRIVVDKSTFSSSTGTLLEGTVFGANQASNKWGGTAGSRFEWVLKSTKEYLIRYDPAAATTNINVSVTWYEVA